MRNISGPIILVLISFSIHEEDTIKGCYAFILWKGNACIPFLERNLLSYGLVEMAKLIFCGCWLMFIFHGWMPGKLQPMKTLLLNC